MESAARASERCSRAMRARARERVKSTPMEQSRTAKGQREGLSREVVVEDDAAERFADDPDAGGEHDAGFDECGEGFDLAVAVVVVLVGGTVGDLDGEEGDGGGDEVDGGVGGFAQHAERAGDDAGDEFEQGDEGGGEDGEDGGRALGGVRLGSGVLVRGRWAHGRDATAFAAAHAGGAALLARRRRWSMMAACDEHGRAMVSRPRW